MQKDINDENLAKIIVYGKFDEDMIEVYDDRFGEIAKRKKIIILDLSKGVLSLETLNKIGIKKICNNGNKFILKECENHKDLRALKDGFWV